MLTRTTISLHESILKRVKSLAFSEKRTLGEVISELLTLGLTNKSKKKNLLPQKVTLPSFSMGVPKVDLEDKELIRNMIEKPFK